MDRRRVYPRQLQVDLQRPAFTLPQFVVKLIYQLTNGDLDPLEIFGRPVKYTFGQHRRLRTDRVDRFDRMPQRLVQAQQQVEPEPRRQLSPRQVEKVFDSFFA